MAFRGVGGIEQASLLKVLAVRFHMVQKTLNSSSVIGRMTKTDRKYTDIFDFTLTSVKSRTIIKGWWLKKDHQFNF